MCCHTYQQAPGLLLAAARGRHTGITTDITHQQPHRMVLPAHLGIHGVHLQRLVTPLNTAGVLPWWKVTRARFDSSTALKPSAVSSCS